MNDNVITKILISELAKYNFKKHNSTWSRNVNDVEQKVELQKSNYGNYYYLNLYIRLIKISEKNIPHIAIRINDVATGDIGSSIDSTLSLETNMNDIDRRTLLSSLITQCILPFFEKADSLQKIEKLLRTELFIQNRSSKQLKKYFEVS